MKLFKTSEMISLRASLKEIRLKNRGEAALRTSVSVTAVLAIMTLLVPWYSAYLSGAALDSAEKTHRVESLQEAEAATAIDPVSTSALLVRAGAEQRIGRWQAAKDSLVKATELEPQNYETWEQLAFYERFKWGEPDLAKEHFQKALSLNPYDQALNAEAAYP